MEQASQASRRSLLPIQPSLCMGSCVYMSEYCKYFSTNVEFIAFWIENSAGFIRISHPPLGADIPCNCVSMCSHMCVCVYTYVERRERERESERESERETTREIYIHLYICTCCTNNLALADSYLRNATSCVCCDLTHTYADTDTDRQKDKKRESVCAHEGEREREGDQERETGSERAREQERERERARARKSEKARARDREKQRETQRARESKRVREGNAQATDFRQSIHIFFKIQLHYTHFEHAQIDGEKHSA